MLRIYVYIFISQINTYCGSLFTLLMLFGEKDWILKFSSIKVQIYIVGKE